MSAIEEDDDAFLYGDGDAAAEVSSGTTGTPVPSDDKLSAKPAEKENSDEAEEDGDDDEEDDDDEEEDSDSDIEFIIGSEESKAPATATDPTASSTAAAEAQTASGIVPEAIGEVTIETEKADVTPVTTGATITRVPGIDINKVGEYDGLPITTINLQDLKEKPWRQPGADASEYFNYGFNELTWTMYCAKQDKLRANFNPQKAMMDMMPLMSGMGGMPAVPSFMSTSGIQIPTIAGGGSLPQFPMMLVGPSEARDGTPKALPTGPASNLPRAPQRQQDFRDRSDRDMERNADSQGYNNSNNNNSTNHNNNSGNYRDRTESRRQRFRGGRR